MLSQNRINQMTKAASSGYNNKFNCWGATKFALGHLTKYQWVKEDAMMAWLNQKTFQLKPRAKLQSGDILVIQKSNGYLLHTAIYLGNRLWFHKKGKFETGSESKLKIINTYTSDMYLYGGFTAKISIRRLNG